MIISQNKERDLTLFAEVLGGKSQASIARETGLSQARIGSIIQNTQASLLHPKVLQDTDIAKPHGSHKTIKLERGKWLVLVERARNMEG